MDLEIIIIDLIPDFLELLSSLELTATPKFDKLIIGIVVGLRSRELVASRSRTSGIMNSKHILVFLVYARETYHLYSKNPLVDHRRTPTLHNPILS